MTIAPDTVLFANGAQRVTAGDLLQTLRDLGVRPGDLLFLHTDLLRFGRPAPELMRVREPCSTRSSPCCGKRSARRAP